ncbi:OsmC family protein [Thozetella sp. PMI_491]|nr:OsmC family protein [Thozetella sp. PMI_491]
MGSSNEFDLDAIAAFAESTKENPRASFKIATKWTGKVKTTSHVAGHSIFGGHHTRDFDILSDEPIELLGDNSAPNPEDLLIAGLNSCMIVGYAVGAAAMGIKLDKLEIVSEGDLDLRGFTGLDPSVNAGYEEIEYTTSPNFSNLATPVKMVPKLVVEPIEDKETVTTGAKA